MNLVTYNLRSGGTGRVHWSRIIEEHDPDIFLVQETAAPQEHLSHPLLAEASDRCAWKKVEGRRWGRAIYSRRGEIRSVELPDFHGHVVGMNVAETEWPVGPGPLRIFSVHAPVRGTYQRAVNQILDMIADHAGGCDLVIGGDFNLCISASQPVENRRTSVADLAIQRRLRKEFGLVNCWQEANVGLPLAQTLRWSNAPEIPYHCDGLFVPESWACHLRTCEVVSSPKWDRLSDHSPVVARFGQGSLVADGRSASDRISGGNGSDTDLQ
jgi:endonuclease/exonuclease/phosphatase family metal-dependent hydrolase